MKTIQHIFVRGLIAVLPLLLSIYLVLWLAGLAERVLGGFIEQVLPPDQYIPGMGIIAGVLTIFFIGLFLGNLIVENFVHWLNEQVEKAPVFKIFYRPLRDVMNLFSKNKDKQLKRVVLVGVLPGIRMLGIVTRERFAELRQNNLDQSLLAVYIPMSYGLGGYTILVPKSYVEEIDLSVDQAMTLALTGWIKTERQSTEDLV